MLGKRITRRQFIERSVIGAAAGAAHGPALLKSSPLPSERLAVGIIGAGIRGFELMEAILKIGGRVAVVCDLYDGHFRRAQEIQANTPTTREYREVLDRKDIDAVIVATSDHWHAPIAIEAMRAGKDVYCEKPMTHKVPEALEMVRISKETGRLVQVGSQSLSMTSTQKAKEWVQGGRIGTVYMVQASIYRPNAIGAWRYPIPPDASPQTVDWERFLGNAPKRPFDAARFFQFRNWWDYGTGIAGDEFVHLLSRIHYVVEVQYPLSAVSSGGLYKWTGDREVPDVHNTLYDYGKFQVVMTANLATNWDGGECVRFLGDNGTVELTEWVANLLPYDPVEWYSYPLASWPKDLRDEFIQAHEDDPAADVGTAPKPAKRAKETQANRAEGTEDHLRNFFECIKTRHQPIENVEFGCQTAIASHLANVSYLRRRRVYWDAERLELHIEA